MKDFSNKDITGYVIAGLIVSLLIAFALSSFVTLVVGLFVAYPFTVMNIFKVWGALIALAMVVSFIRGK